MESCTITALDAITAFAVPNPSYVLAEQPVFSGRVVFQVALADAITQLTLDWLNFHLRQPFQPSTREKVNAPTQIVNAVFWCSGAAFPVHSVDRIRLQREALQSGISEITVFHRSLHSHASQRIPQLNHLNRLTRVAHLTHFEKNRCR